MFEPGADAIAANGEGGALLDDRRFAEAIPHLELAQVLAPLWHSPPLKLCIAYKQIHDWPRALSACLRALELDEEKSAGAMGSRSPIAPGPST